jgi:glycosyltransferase involved in cell wall biosynthesis
VVTGERRILWPARLPLLAPFLNRVLAPLPLLRRLCLTHWIVARRPMPLERTLGVSVICPCRNEAGNVRAVAERLPDFGGPAELIFVEGHSKDETPAACRAAAEEFKARDISVLQQTGRGKGDAVRLGFSKAKHPILVILDGDLTVAPEELPGFVEALREGRAELVNGSRLVYPRAGKAMRLLNLVGNKFFSQAFSFLVGQPVKDTLCGTKALLKSDYERLAAQRAYFKEHDPFGDFDLLFGAAKLGLRIMDYPVRYGERTYGETQIRRFRHGFLLLRMCGVALVKLRMR